MDRTVNHCSVFQFLSLDWQKILYLADNLIIADEEPKRMCVHGYKSFFYVAFFKEN